MGLLRKLLGELHFPFCVNMWSQRPAAKRIGADMWEFAAPETGEVVSNRKTFKTAAKSVGKKTEKTIGRREPQCCNDRKREGACRRELAEGSLRTAWRQAGSKQRKIIPTKSTKQSSRSRRDIFTNISR